jgi:hypothetical protein
LNLANKWRAPRTKRDLVKRRQDDASYIAKQVRARVTEDLRSRMVTRTMHVIRSLQESGKTPAYVAKQVVDTIFAEVL